MWTNFVLKVYFYDIPEEIIDTLVNAGILSTWITFRSCYAFRFVLFSSLIDCKLDQIEDDVTFKVAGGLMLEHPLTLPLVEAVVSNIVLLICFCTRSNIVFSCCLLDNLYKECRTNWVMDLKGDYSNLSFVTLFLVLH